MKRLAFVLAVALAAPAGSAADVSFKGPFGPTRLVAWVVAADPVTNRILVQTPDGRLRVFVVEADAERRFAALRVGDQVILAFDDRVAGDRVLEIETAVVTGRTSVPSTSVPMASLLPGAVVLGAPALSPFRGRTYGTVAEVGLVEATAAGAPAPGPALAAGGGVALGTVPTGVVNEQGVSALGLGAANGRILTGPGGEAVVAATPGFAPGTTQGNFTPGTVVPGVTTTSPDQFGRPAVTSQGGFAPGTVVPGVTLANPAAAGRPTVQGNFTPGTVAPGVSARLGNAPPAAPSTTAGVRGSSGSPGGLTIANPGALPPVPETPANAANGTAPLAPGGAGGTSATGANVATTPGATSPPGSATATSTDPSAQVAPPGRVSGQGGASNRTSRPSSINTRPAGPQAPPTGSRTGTSGTVTGGSGGSR